MTRIVTAILMFSLSACYAEWDIPKTSRTDPCTGKFENKYVYVYPTCRYPLPPDPPAGAVK